MTLARRWLTRAWPARPVNPAAVAVAAVGTPALEGLWETDLDLRSGHFGPTSWCRTWTEWLGQLRRDAPEQVYLIADAAGERRVHRVLGAHDLRETPSHPHGFAFLKYYRHEHGASVAVSFALEAVASAAD